MIAKQPNGRYCRFSSIVDTFTHINMTKEDYLNNFTGNCESREYAEDILENHLVNFTDALIQVTDLNINIYELREMLAKMIENNEDAKAEIC